MPEKVDNGEIWKDIPGYEGYYQVSSLGRVRSLDRWVAYSEGKKVFYKGRIAKGCVRKGYRQTTLTKANVGKTYKFSQLVAMAFLEHEPNGHTLVVDHINGDRSDDRLENLRIVTNRENASTCFRSDKGSLSSKYIGVCWYKWNSKWLARIVLNGKTIRLGYFEDEIDASKAYQLALSKIKDGSFNPDDYKPKFTSKHKGVCFNKRDKKWVAYIRTNDKRSHLGCYPTELEAHKARLKAEKEQKSA